MTTCNVNSPGFEYGTLTNYGHRDRETFDKNGGIYMWKYHHNTSIALDISLTIIFLCFFLTLFGFGGTRIEVVNMKCPLTSDGLLKRRPWKYTPVNIRNLLLRSLAMAAYFSAILIPPTLLVLGLIMGSEKSLSVYEYCTLKGFYAFLLAAPVYTLCHLNATVECEFEKELRDPTLDAPLIDVSIDDDNASGPLPPMERTTSTAPSDTGSELSLDTQRKKLGIAVAGVPL